MYRLAEAVTSNAAFGLGFTLEIALVMLAAIVKCQRLGHVNEFCLTVAEAEKPKFKVLMSSFSAKGSSWLHEESFLL